MGKTIDELHALLIEYEKCLHKKAATQQEMAIQGKEKDKIYIPKPKNPKPYAIKHPPKDDACHHYKEVGHCKRNCSAYRAELINKKKQVGTASSLAIFTIELFCFPNKFKVYDTGCSTHICNTKQGLRGERKLKQGALYLCVGNGVRAYVEAIRKISERAEELAKIQDKDTSPFENTSEIPMEVEGIEPPQEKVVPIHRSTIGSKWLFKKKTDMDGIVHTYKARLVAKGYTQTYGVDYKETFSLVADIRAIRILIAIATFYDYKIWQMDVKTAFLNGYLNEDIYMVQSKCFVDPNHPRKNPGEQHSTAVKTILKYLRNTKEMFLVYGGNPEVELRVDRYCDAGFETDRDDIKSQTRYVFISNGGTMDWKSSKQSTIAMSATEAEYISASKAAMEAVWIRKFILGLGIVPTINDEGYVIFKNT
nr:retrovirus-related Pol polyprotein from transposon TNT 1-94 [Tanacetum cinerariifolium]